MQTNDDQAAVFQERCRLFFVARMRPSSRLPSTCLDDAGVLTDFIGAMAAGQRMARSHPG